MNQTKIAPSILAVKDITVLLKLKKPLKAKGLFLEFYGERKVSRFTGKRRTTRTVKVFDFKQPLDGEKES